MNGRTSWSAALLALAFALAAAAAAQDGVVPYPGEATRAIRATIDEAKNDALDAACRDAVARAAAEIAGPAFEKSQAAIERDVLARWNDYLQGYDVVEESRGVEGFRTKVRARVLVDRLRADVGKTLAAATTSDAALVLAVGTEDGRAGEKPRFAAGIEKALAGGGRTLLAAERRAEAVRALDLGKVLSGDAAALGGAVQAAGGRFAVVARDLERDAAGCLVRVALVVVDAKAADPLLSKTYRVTPAAADCAAGEEKIAAGLAKVALDAIAAVAPATEAEAPPPPAEAERLVVATGQSRFADVTGVRNLLAAQKAIRAVRLIHVEPGGKAVYGVIFDGTPDDLAALLAGKRHGDLIVGKPKVDDGRVVFEVTHAVEPATP